MSDMVEFVIKRGVELAAKQGKTLDFEKYLPTLGNRSGYTAREVVNAVGKALDELGIQNNLVR